MRISISQSDRRDLTFRIISLGFLISLLATMQPAHASSPVTWTKMEFVCNCTSIATSSDGSKVVVADDSGSLGGRIYTSANYGAAWTSRATNRLWSGLASSSDGTKLVATIKEGPIFTSTDSGANWTERASNRRWDSVASSSDGTKLVAGIEGGTLFTSSDSGMTWTQRESARNWTSVASSSDGTKLVAVARADQIFTSKDSGATWVARDSARLWRSVSSSSDGTRLAAAVYSSSNDSWIYLSSDSGATWVPRANDTSRYWQSVGMSGNGSKLVASSYQGTVYTSDDFGASWVSGNTIQNGSAVATSTDGNVFYVVGTLGAYLYTTATLAKPTPTASSKPTAPATPTSIATTTPQPSSTTSTNGKKASIGIKKITSKIYQLQIRNGTPNSRYTVIATKKGKNTYEYGGYTDPNGSATINVSANLAGYSAVVRMGYK